jgi:hypothetical protein
MFLLLYAIENLYKNSQISKVDKYYMFRECSNLQSILILFLIHIRIIVFHFHDFNKIYTLKF